MLHQSPRLLCAAGLRDCVCLMSARLGNLGNHWATAHVQQLQLVGHHGITAGRGLLELQRPRDTLRRISACSSKCSGPSDGRPQPSASQQPVGRIDLILGPMFAGKTSELLRRAEEHEAAGRKVALVKSTVDNRYHRTRVVSHDGKSKACFAVASLEEFRARAGEEEYRHIQVIAIDEAQFLPDLLAFCARAADVDGKHVLLAGLDGDFQRRRFGQVLDLVSLADSVTKLAGGCAYCARPALFSLRIAADARQALVGGSDKYAPVCRQHYVALHQPALPQAQQLEEEGSGAEPDGVHRAAELNGSLAAKA